MTCTLPRLTRELYGTGATTFNSDGSIITRDVYGAVWMCNECGKVWVVALMTCGNAHADAEVWKWVPETYLTEKNKQRINIYKTAYIRTNQIDNFPGHSTESGLDDIVQSPWE